MNLFSKLEAKIVKNRKACCAYLADTSNLDELRKMTFQLGTKHGGSVPYHEKEKNGITELKIYEQSNVEILYISVKKGTIFPEHEHSNAREMIAISKGSLSVEMGPMTSMHKAGEFLYLELGQPHQVIILEDSILIVTFLKAVNGICNVGN